MSEPTIGARIRAARSTLGLTQADVAKKLGFDTTGTVSRWERDVLIPSDSALGSLQKYLFDPAEKLSFEIKDQEASGGNKPTVAKPKLYTKEQLIISLVDLGREKGKYKLVMDLLLSAKAQGYTIDSLTTLMTQIEP